MISAAVMAHPKRKKQAEALAKQLRQWDFVGVTISYDGLDAHTHQDEWNNGKRALLAGLDKGRWHLVLQDDAILSPGFFESLVSAIKAVPTKSLISLYTGSPRPFPKRVSAAVNKARDGEWLSYWLLLWGVGIVIPSDHIQPMIDFVDDRGEPYDTRIGMFYNANMLPVYYTSPSLVDHNDDLNSLLDHGKAGGRRVAYRTATGPVQFFNKVINL